MVDPEHGFLGEDLVDDTREPASGCEVASERLLDDEPPARARRLPESAHDGCEHAGRDREVAKRKSRVAQRSAEAIEGRRVAIVAFDVADLARERRERAAVDAAVLREAVPDPRAQSLHGPAGARDADDRHGQRAAADERLQCRVDLPVHEIARRTEQHERVGLMHGDLRTGCRLEGFEPDSFDVVTPNSAVENEIVFHAEGIRIVIWR